MKPFIGLVILGIVLFLASPVWADVAPPSPPPGSNLLPGAEITQVRMLAETVVLDVQTKTTTKGNGVARVSASFTMRNLGAEAESMAVRFPISANDGFFNYPEIKDFQASVDGRHARTRRITIPDPGDNDHPLPWAEFDVTFPPGVDVLIEVAYTLEGVGEYPYTNFEYVLETGAGWQGTIGSVDLIVRLPYDANPYNVLVESGWGMGQTSTGMVMEGKELRWHYNDLDPEWKDNLSVALLLPEAWNEVIKEQGNVARNPQDGEAWGRLGKMYKITSRLRRGLRDDAGGRELFQLGVKAYEQAITLLPNDALWHAGFAELLYDGFYWDEYSSAEKPGMLRALQELARAYALKPRDSFILDLIEEVHYALPEALLLDGDQPVFLWLTATPTSLLSPTSTLSPSSTPTASPLPATPTLEATSSPSPTTTAIAVFASATALPEITSTPPADNPEGELQVCGITLLLPVGILLIVSSRAGKPKRV